MWFPRQKSGLFSSKISCSVLSCRIKFQIILYRKCRKARFLKNFLLRREESIFQILEKSNWIHIYPPFKPTLKLNSLCSHFLARNCLYPELPTIWYFTRLTHVFQIWSNKFVCERREPFSNIFFFFNFQS